MGAISLTLTTGKTEMARPGTYGVDEEGFIATHVSALNVPMPYFEIIEDVKRTFGELIGDQLHGLHLYGSVVTGRALTPTSDLDVLIVLRRQPAATLTSQIDNTETALSRKYEQLVREVAVGVTFLEEVGNDLHGTGCFIKHLCVCVLGESLQESLPRFKPTQLVAKAFNGDFGALREKYLSLVDTTPPDEISKLSNRIYRKFIRTGFSLVTAREQSWTTDLNVSCEAFAKYYPDKADQMRRVLQLSNQAELNKGDLLEILTGFGGWLADEVEREFSMN